MYTVYPAAGIDRVIRALISRLGGADLEDYFYPFINMMGHQEMVPTSKQFIRVGVHGEATPCPPRALLYP